METTLAEIVELTNVTIQVQSCSQVSIEQKPLF
jgi:hypothetical protein